MAVEALWKPDPDGGFIRIAPAGETEDKDPSTDPLWGWKPDPKGEGYVRMNPDEMPPIPRKGVWCQIFGLSQSTDMNGLIVEASEEATKDGTVEITFDGNQKYLINAYNLTPVRGSEKLGKYHHVLSLKVNGINCDNCKRSLMDALIKVKGVDSEGVDIKTKAKTGASTNPVLIKGAFDDDEVLKAIKSLDNNRGKFTIA